MLKDEQDAIEESPRDEETFEKCGRHVRMGIDEAGRGPVLGPMVYCAFVCCSDVDDATLEKTGFADSKTLSPDRRSSLLAAARRDHHFAWFVRSLSPELLSRDMLRRARINLNTLSHAAAASLVRRALDTGLVIDQLAVDTVGDPSFYKRYLSAQFPSIAEIIVEPRADATYPTVSAASIVAKVTRDEQMRDWRFREPGLSYSRQFGSGYPADPDTKAWLDTAFDPVFGYPSVIRFSWQTTKRRLAKLAVPVVWEDIAADGYSESSSGEPATKQSKLSFAPAASADRYRYFAETGLEPVSTLI